MDNKMREDNNHGDNRVNHNDMINKIDALEDELKKLKLELEEEKKRHLRTRADFDNYRKRVARDADLSRINAKKEVLLDLLTYLDYFEQAARQVKDPAAARGIEIMARQFEALLEKHGVKPVECLGKPFDPEEHEGIGYISSDDCPEGCVAEEVSCGYKLGDLLLRPARVMVAKTD